MNLLQHSNGEEASPNQSSPYLWLEGLPKYSVHISTLGSSCSPGLWAISGKIMSFAPLSPQWVA